MEITSCFVRFQWSRIAPFNPVRFLIDDSRRGNRSIGEHRQVRQAGGSYLLSLWIEAICTQLARPLPSLHGQPARVSRHSRLRHPGAVESISYPIESQSSKWTSKGQYWNESLRNLSRRCTEDACWNAWEGEGGDNISKSAVPSYVHRITIKIFFYRLNFVNRCCCCCCWIFVFFVSMGLKSAFRRIVAQYPRTKNTFLIAYKMQFVVEFAGSSDFKPCKNFLRRNCSRWL